jgi:hypothetical protein
VLDFAGIRVAPVRIDIAGMKLAVCLGMSIFAESIEQAG